MFNLKTTLLGVKNFLYMCKNPVFTRVLPFCLFFVKYHILKCRPKSLKWKELNCFFLLYYLELLGRKSIFLRIFFRVLYRALHSQPLSRVMTTLLLLLLCYDYYYDYYLRGGCDAHKPNRRFRNEITSDEKIIREAKKIKTHQFTATADPSAHTTGSFRNDNNNGHNKMTPRVHVQGPRVQYYIYIYIYSILAKLSKIRDCVASVR